MKTKEDLIEEYIKEIRNKVTNFDWKVQTSALLFNFFKNNGYSFYFTPKLKPIAKSKSLTKNPDFHACKKDKLDILGEIKQSLPNPTNNDYDKKVNKDIKQLIEYQQPLLAISTPHDLFLSAPAICNDAIQYYINIIEGNDNLKNKVIILKYLWMVGGSHNRLTIQKIYGTFSDINIENNFKYKDYQAGDEEINDIQGYYKIFYTEEEYNDTPREYIMVILWHNVIPELKKLADFDKTIERIKKGENKLSFSIDEIMKIFDNLYTLRSSKDEIISQFNRKMIIDAMEGFVKIQKAKKIDNNIMNPSYEIYHSKISSSKPDLIDTLIRELNKEDFKEKAEIEYNKLVNQPLI